MMKILHVLGMRILVICGTTIAMGLFPLSSSMLIIQSAEATTGLYRPHACINSEYFYLLLSLVAIPLTCDIAHLSIVSTIIDNN
jgi:hypothetical protein